jgi:hypothetical protein
VRLIAITTTVQKGRPAVADDIVKRLEEADPNLLRYVAGNRLISDVVDEIEALRSALALAVGELSTHEHWGEFDHHEVVAHFLEEARRG